MKPLRTIISVLILLLSFSCGNEKNSRIKEKEVLLEKKEDISKSKIKMCKIFVKGIFPKDDAFELFYTELATDQFSQKNSMSRGFKGKKETQELVFDLLDYYPEKIRLDIGSNRNMKELYIEEILINYDEKVFKIDNSNISQYLSNNQFISIGEQNKFNLSLIEINGKKTYDPYFISTPLLVKELVRL